MHQSPQEEIEGLQLRHPRDFSSKRLLRVSACPAECCTWTRLHSYRQRQGLCNWVLQDAVLIVLQQPMAFRAPLSQAQVKPSLSLVSGLHSSLGSNQAFFEKIELPNALSEFVFEFHTSRRTIGWKWSVLRSFGQVPAAKQAMELQGKLRTDVMHIACNCTRPPEGLPGFGKILPRKAWRP